MKVGIDIEEISRFENKTLKNDETFLKRIFTERELSYCFSNSNPAQHLTARFCAKEALIKAMADKKIPLNKIETLNDKEGKPTINLIDYGVEIEADISLSHCNNYACANVLLVNVKKSE